MNFEKVKINYIKKLTSNCVEIEFDKKYDFIAGQYLNIRVEYEGKQEVRAYSICSTENENLRIAVKEITNGRVSKYLNSIDKNIDIEISKPNGVFNFDNNSNVNVFIAAGSGITPIISMIQKSISLRNSRNYLFYSSKNEDNTIFYKELLELVNNNKDLFKLKFNFTQIKNSRYTQESLLYEFKNTNNIDKALFYCCGPNDLIMNANRAFDSLNISKERFKREYFTAKDESETIHSNVSVGQEDDLQKGEKADIQIILEGKKYNFSCNYNSNIIDAALDNNIHPPYSCMVAACCTCRAKLLNGKVEMNDRDSLSDKDISKGFVLTCQSMPRTKNILLNFDE